MTQRNGLILGATLFLTFLLLTPLGIFNHWIPPDIHKGFYSVTTIDGGDDAGYYAFLRSVFFDGDLDFFNELNYVHSEKIMSTGYVFNNWQMGQALFFLPFFIIGHWLALFYQEMGYPISVAGYSAPYYISTAVASVTFLFAGLMLVFKTLHSFIDKRFALLVSLCIWLASPLIYFSFVRQRMAHTLEFFLASALIYAWVHFRLSRDPVRYAVLGALLGFLCMTRVINIAFFALFAVDLIWRFRSDWKVNAPETMKIIMILGAAIGGGFFVVMLPQIIAWYQLNGVPFPPRHMKFAGEGLSGISFLPALKSAGALFFSPQWGLFFSMPLAVAGLMGLFLRNEWLKDILPALLAYLAGIFSVLILYPEDSASYGHRHLISALPVFALGLGNLLHRIAESRFKWGIRLAIFMCISSVFLQYCMLVQYKVTLPYNHPEFSLEVLRTTGELITHRPDLLTRSSNFFSVLFLSHSKPWDYLDGLFLLIFPILQLAGLAVVLFFMKGGLSRFQALVLSPKFMLGKSVVISILLLTIVMVSAPTKTQSEISDRMKYKDAFKNAEMNLRSGKIIEARDDFMQASARIPQAWKPYFMIGQTWQARGNIDEANRFYLQALVYNPSHSPTLTLLGNNYKRLGNTDDAEKTLRSAIRAWPLNLQAYDSLAQVLATQGNREEAIEMLNYAVQINPSYGPGHVNLAMTYHSLNQEEKSKYHLGRAIALGMQGPVVDQVKSMIFKTPQ
ncbi:MAG: tetratricopeptide repeat protein [Nitrospina sp.]|nr:tetratricopeptide repeat protein [Nitrospina sp.]